MFYIETKSGRRFVMDVENTINLTTTGKPTMFPLDSNFDASDHYRQPFDRISVSGLVTGVKMNTGIRVSTSLEDFETGLYALKRSGERFSVSVSDNLQVFKNCVFENLSLRRSTPGSKWTLRVSLTISVLEVAQQAALVDYPKTAEEYESLMGASKRRAYTTDVNKETDILDGVAEGLGAPWIGNILKEE